MAKENTQQQLFGSPQNSYGWKSVQEAHRGDFIVVEQQEIRVLGVRHDGNSWFVSYTDPSSEKKVEQLYSATDFVYAKL